MTDRQKWLIGMSTVGLGLLVYLLAPVLTPFLFAMLLAYLGDPLVDRLQQHLSRVMAVVVTFLAFTGVVVVSLFVLIPMLETQITVLLQKAPGYIERIEQFVFALFEDQLQSKTVVLNLIDVEKVIREHWQQAGGVVKGVLVALSSSGMVLIAWMVNIVLVPVLTFYLLRDWDDLLMRLRGLIPRRFEATCVQLIVASNDVLGAFLRGQLLVMVALGGIYSVGLWLIGLEFSVLIGMLAGVVSFVPYLGFVIGILVAGIAVLLQFQEAFQLVYVLVVFGVGQVVESVVLTPLLVGDRIGLHPVAVIFAILAGGQLFGFLGVLLALPVAAVLMVLLRYAKQYYINSDFYKTHV